MKVKTIVFIGRTGVGKSSLVNFLSGKCACETDRYRPCTKELKLVEAEVEGSMYRLLDTPGLGEAGEELDLAYLELIDRELRDTNAVPALVFKGDDSRLRSEDHALLAALCKRYGADIYNHCELYLTFGGNLGDEYASAIHSRVKLITCAIYSIQMRVEQELFPGFSRVQLLDSDLKQFFEIDPPDKDFAISPEVLLATSVRKQDYAQISRILGIEEEFCDGVFHSLLALEGLSALPYGFDDWSRLADRISLFPFHNAKIGKSPLTGMTKNAPSSADKEPTSVYEVAELLGKHGLSDNSLTIEGGTLVVVRIQAHRTYVDSGRFANCVSVKGFCYKQESGSLMYRVYLKLVNHPYLEDGEPDATKILLEAEEAAILCGISCDSFVKFARLILYSSELLDTGQTAMEKAISDDLENHEVWQESSLPI